MSKLEEGCYENKESFSQLLLLVDWESIKKWKNMF